MTPPPLHSSPTYFERQKSLPVRYDVESYAIDGPRQGDAPDEEDDEEDVG